MVTLRLKYSINLLLRFLGGIGISSWSICSVPDAHGQCTDQFLTRIIRMFWRDLFQFGIFMLILIIRICSGYISIPDDYAQQTHQFLTRMLRVRISSWCVCKACFEDPALWARISSWREAKCMDQFLTRMLSARISSWRVYLASTSVPNAHAETDAYASVPDALAQRAHQELTRMLSVLIKVGSCS
jgi:hypothetical protein